MKRSHLRTLIGGLSFGTALFVFQACYGMPQDMMDDVFISGKVVSLSSGLPLEGIQVESEMGHYSITDSTGEFAFYSGRADSIAIHIQDADPASDGDYLSKDTVLVNPERNVFLNIALEER